MPSTPSSIFETVPLADRLICGHGSNHPQAILVIDHPQGDDFVNGYALTGASENTVRGLMRDVGLYYENFYVTALIKTTPAATLDSCKGPGGGTKKYQELNQPLINTYTPLLVNEIKLLNSNLIIPLGELSFNALTSLHGIRKFRGSILQTDIHFLGDPGRRIKVLPALGPYPYLNQDYKMRMITKLDFNRISSYSNDSNPPESKINVWVCKTPGALRSFIDRHYRIDGYLTFDIETYFQVPICISFSFDGQEACCVPLLDYSIDADIRALMWILVAKLLASPIAKGNQNIKYDWKILERWFFIVNNIQHDTMLAASCIYPEFPKNLGFLTSIYTELPYFKDEGHDFEIDEKKRGTYYLYNAKDSIAAWQVQKKQEEEMLEFGTYTIYRKLIECMPIYKRAECRGLRVDPTIRAKLQAKYETLFNIEKIKLQTLVGDAKLNPLSSLQMNNLVFKEYGYQQGRYVYGTDEESLEWLILFAEHRSMIAKNVLKIILNCRKLHKVIEILELPLWPDGRFRCEFNLAGTETGRSSAGKTTDQLLIIKDNKIKIKNLGHSLQTIGKHGFSIDGITYGRDIRDMYVPSHGYNFVEIDLSGAEARVDRVLSGNFDMEVFNNPGIHKLTGSWLYACDPSEIKKNILVDGVDRYHVSKTVRHAGERNMKPDRLVMMIGRPRQECVELLDLFHRNAPEIRAVYHRDIINAIQATHTLVMPNGRRRDFFDRISYDTFNEGFSTIPQSIVSDQTKFEGILPTFIEFEWAEFLIEQHDGCLAEVPCGREIEFAELYCKNIEKPIDFRQGSIKKDYQLVIPAEVSIGENWSGLKEVKR